MIVPKSATISCQGCGHLFIYVVVFTFRGQSNISVYLESCFCPYTINSIQYSLLLASRQSLQAPKEKESLLFLNDQFPQSAFDWLIIVINKRAFEHPPIVRRSGRWLRYVGQRLSGVVSELIGERDGWGRPCLFRQILTCKVWRDTQRLSVGTQVIQTQSFIF